VNRRFLLIASLTLNVVLLALLIFRGPAAPSPEPVVSDIAAEPPSPTGAATPSATPPPAPPPARAPSRTRAARERTASPVETTTVPAATPPAPAADSGTLRIESDVPGAQVFIDRRFIGVTPLTVGDIRPGSHQMNASVEGFEGVANTIDVNAGTQQLMIRFREVRLDARADVVHKHRIGSCKGQLVATAQGLRYDTVDKDDVFSVALLDIDQFDLDYMDKNLRIRVKNGKTYNFTDSQGKADRLFVLHRDVEKAREKLKAGGVPATD
jgi:hypothetical protein